ncbi:MAG: gliding motility protein GldM [Bacteroidota bacterium]
MAGGNISPRQKMINMMYLVLTAMLALNVSAEILKAFHMVEVSMDKAGVNVDQKNMNSLKAISSYHEKNPGDAIGTDIHNKALQVQKIADDASKYVTELKDLLIAQADGRKEGIADEELLRPDNIEMHANYLIVKDGGANGEALRKKIEETRDKLIGVLPKDKQGLVKSDLTTQTEKGSTQTWQSEMFEHTPLAAVVALLSKTVNDIKNTESQVLDILKAGLTDDIVIVSNFEAKVIPNNGTYITIGSEYSADIFLAASTRQEADIKVGGATVKVENGVGKYTVNPSREGEIEYSGVITTKRSGGKIETYPFKSSFTALKPLAVISATKMNVVYIGLDNPISVSVPGYSANQVQVACSAGGTLSKDKQAGTYLLRVTGTAKEVEITASVKDPKGSVKKMGIQKYRVRPIPKPMPMLGSIEQSGPVSAGVLKSAAFVFANLKDFAFEGVKFTPFEYTIVYQPKKGDGRAYKGTSQTVSPEIRAVLANVRMGDRITLLQVKANGPAGGVVIPASLSLEVK